jgi:hypothetical protein
MPIHHNQFPGPHQLPPKTDDVVFMNLSHVPAGNVSFVLRGGPGCTPAPIVLGNVGPDGMARGAMPPHCQATQVVCHADIGGVAYRWTADIPGGHACAALFGVIRTSVAGADHVVPFGETIISTAQYESLSP